jgi:hypothetical protein
MEEKKEKGNSRERKMGKGTEKVPREEWKAIKKNWKTKENKGRKVREVRKEWKLQKSRGREGGR